MKLRNALLAAALGAAGIAQAAYTEVYIADPPYRGEPITIYNAPGLVDGSPFHTGGATLEDSRLADHIAAAVASDRRIDEPNMTATFAAQNGRVSISGSGNEDQAARVEQLAARTVGHSNVTVMMSPLGGA